MKRKIFSILLTLVLALSLCLVTAVPAAAAEPPPQLDLISVGTGGVVEWVDAETIPPCTGDYSVKMFVVEGNEGGVGVYIPVNVAIEDIESLSFSRLGTIGDKDAKINLLIDADSDGDLDFTATDALEYHRTSVPDLGEDAMLFLNPNNLIDTDTWATVDAYNVHKYFGKDKTGQLLSWSPYNDFLGQEGGVQDVGVGSIDPTDKVLGVIVLLGCGSKVDHQTVYIDDIEINGVTYELEEALSGWHVYDGKSIQDAIDTVASGDTINVEAGTYNENILINKALTLTGTDGATETIIDGTGSYIVTIQHSDVTFQGFTVKNPGYEGSAEGTGILIHTTETVQTESVSNVQILDNMVTQVRSGTGTKPSTFGSVGICVGYAKNKGNTLSDIVISGNTITDIKNPSQYTSSCKLDHTCGINVWDGADNIVIYNNTISDIKFNGIILEGASNVQIYDNSITGCESGVRVKPIEWEISNVQIEDNDITGCEYGISVVPEANLLSGLTVNLNKIFGNQEFGVLNATVDSIDATLNWWGTAIESQIAKMVSGNVDYSPWLDAADGVSTSLDVTTISLASGWNLISLPLIPEAPSITTVLDGVDASKVAYYTGGPDGSWLYYNTTEPGINDLTTMNDGKGYWIDMSTAGTLTISGYELCAPPPDVPPSYDLVEGWNLIGFKSLASDTDVAIYLGTAVTGTMEAMYGYDAAAGLYTIILDNTELVLGDGYWLAVSAEGTIYP